MASTIFESKAAVLKSSSKILVATVELNKILAITDAPIIFDCKWKSSLQKIDDDDEVGVVMRYAVYAVLYWSSGSTSSIF